MSAVDPKSFNTPESDIFGPHNIDNVARAVLTLTREVAVLSDRVMVLEELLEQNGVVLREAIDTYQPSDQFQARADKALQVIAGNVIAALQGADGGN
ncbi:hypothetical protein G6N82_05095 [Altererythrobacter sp. BO-6]|uniref:hypothetical protein n=1 Tax=Altererythrobacter sp. BO-6 TaxID=2604537 RepID=UPI0013E1C535|nr:hypothetical protein [Altererythrobacter sp. BO-6]QIG53612.1 hypothetical protein G6N82_05095 [Altererythrobacter sp. BO-6]